MAKLASHVVLPALVLLVGLLPASPTRADEPSGDALVTQIFEVGALTGGVVSYIPGRLGTISPDMVSDEDNPLFGAEGEEPVLPRGSIDELIDVLQTTVAPVFWEVTDGAAIESLGEDRLIVRATTEVMGQVAERLAAFERSSLATLSLDFVVLEGAPLDRGAGVALTDDRVSQLLAKGPIRHVLSLALVDDQVGVASAVTEQAYVEDYDVEVATKATAADPIVGIATYGMEVAASGWPSGDAGRLFVRVRVQIAEPRAVAHHTLAGDTRIELPRYAAAPVSFEALVEPGRWYAAPGAEIDQRAFTLLYRARRTPAPVSAARPDTLPPWPAPDTAPLQLGFFDVRDLNAPLWDTQAEDVHLVPSNFTLPERPELPEPQPTFPIDALVDFLTRFAPSRAWNRTGTEIEARNGTLVVHQTPSMIAAIRSRLEAIRQHSLRSTDVEFQLLDVPTPLALALGSGPDGGGRLSLSDRALAGLDAAIGSGEARAVARARASAIRGTLQALANGVRRHYIADYEIEIAEDSAIPNPIVQQFFEGLVAECRPVLSADGRGARISLRFSASRLDAMAQATTPHGPIDTPMLSILESRSDVFVPLGRTALVYAGGDGERTRILLATPTVEAR